jgi:hypothetical protein
METVESSAAKRKHSIKQGVFFANNNLEEKCGDLTSIKSHCCDDACMTEICIGHNTKDHSRVVRIHTYGRSQV